MAGKIYVGDIGTEIVIDLGQDISIAKSIILYVKKPDGSETTWTPTIYDKSCIKYVCKFGDLDQKGKYMLQPSITLTYWSGLGDTVTFQVYEKWK